MDSARPPWLLIDIDGVLALDVSNSVSRRTGLTRHSMMVHELGRRQTWHLKGSVVPQLKALAGTFDLAWCSWWTHHSEGIGRAVLLGGFPHVTFDERADGYSKVPGVLRFTAGRPFVWLDDDVTEHEEYELAAVGTPHLLIRVDPSTGLMTEHLDRARDWATSLP